MKRIFISRELTAESNFRALFASYPDIEIAGESLLEFSPIPFDTVPDTDWIFFSSKQGVRFFFSQIQNLGISLPENMLWAALGAGTAQALEAAGKVVDFTGNGHPSQTGYAFASRCKGQRVLFPQAEHSRRSIQPYLAPGTCVIDLTVYSNRIRSSFSVPESNLLILTSPLNARAFFSAYSLKPHQLVVAIGESTQKELIRLGVPKIFLPAAPSETGLAQLALDLLTDSIATT